MKRNGWTKGPDGYTRDFGTVRQIVRRARRHWEWRVTDPIGGQWGFARTMRDAIRIAAAHAKRRLAQRREWLTI